MCCQGRAIPLAASEHFESVTPKPLRVMASDFKGSRPCPWESKAGNTGLVLADVQELSMSTGAKCTELQNVPADQIHDSAEGYSFVSFTRLQEIHAVRTIRPFILILKGFVKHKLAEIETDDSRISQLILSVFDHVSNVTEPRALTLINAASDEADFVCKTHVESALRIRDEVKVTLFMEIRKESAAATDWTSFGNVQAFSVYTESLVKSAGLMNKAVLHRVVDKDTYIMRRALIPLESRDGLYKKSGQCSVQIRAARLPLDPWVFGENDVAAVTRAGEHLPGWLGAFASNGVFYVRVLDEHIREAREFWLQADERFDDEKMSIKCSKQYRVQGFVAGTTCKDVLTALRAVGWNVVPLKVVHVQELSTAIVASDRDPSQWRSVAQGSL